MNRAGNPSRFFRAPRRSSETRCAGGTPEMRIRMPMRPYSLAASVALVGGLAVNVLTAGPARSAGADALVQAAQAAPADSTAPAAWSDTLAFSGHVEAGITFNPDSPADGINFGHLFTDRANKPLLNQLMLTAARPLDPKATGVDFGFKLQGLYGSDARFTHSFNLLDRSISGRNQIDIVEANGLLHLAGIGEGGVDVKLGIFPSPMSAESIDASANALYSHSYIFNFGVPFKHTGLLTTTHLTSALDLYLGVDTGVNAFLGEKGDNNDALAGQLGIGLNLLDGNLTIVALSHIGPENPEGAVDFAGNPIRVNSALRYLNDVLVTWKITDALTSTTDLNFIHDDGLHASGGGVAQYLTYSLSDQWTLIGRAEIWRDDKGAFVAKFPANLDAVNAARGFPNTAVSGGSTTYGALTLGANFKPSVPKAIDGFVIRPEIRVDDALNGTRPFNNGTSSHQVTFAADFILPF
jgi:hypothetical protein